MYMKKWLWGQELHNIFLILACFGEIQHSWTVYLCSCLIMLAPVSCKFKPLINVVEK
uniref:Uncharacterized protein n=1 Tax=Rhizophora mucronata TaxID=61149 RepID=A0A2P2J349_RHIMU